MGHITELPVRLVDYSHQIWQVEHTSYQLLLADIGHQGAFARLGQAVKRLLSPGNPTDCGA